MRGGAGARRGAGRGGRGGPHLEAAEGRIRLAAALAFADRGDRRCVGALAALLDADAPDVRHGAADALQAVRGGGVGFDPLATPPSRRAAVEAWRKWILAQPADAAWEHPLPVGPRQLGRTLVSFYTEHRVIELDAEGKRIFQVDGLDGPWAVQGLPNGHRLVALHPARTIVEYDAAGAEVSRLPVPGAPGGFQRLDNGHTLVALTDQDRVVELRPDGAVAAGFTVRGQPMDARLLDSGRLLVCLSNPAQVVELERTGRIAWSLGGIQNAFTARRLENGNTLVAEAGNSGRAAEFDPSGRVVWERAGLRNCYSAERLPDGSTLLADSQGVREIAPDGKERWHFRTNSFSRASRY